MNDMSACLLNTRLYRLTEHSDDIIIWCSRTSKGCIIKVHFTRIPPAELQSANNTCYSNVHKFTYSYIISTIHV